MKRIRSLNPNVTGGGTPPPPANCPPTARAVDSLGITESNLLVKVGGGGSGSGIRDSLAIADAYQRLTTIFPETLDFADQFAFAQVEPDLLDSMAVDESRMLLNAIVADTLGVAEANLLVNPRLGDSLGIGDFFAAPTVTIEPADSLGIRESKLTFTLTMLASQDSWYDNPPACVGAVGNQDGNDLELNSLIAAPKYALLNWDMSQLPSNLTLTAAAATVVVYQKTVPVVNGNFDLLQSVAGTFDETTLVCDNAPAESFTVIAGSISQAIGDRTFTLNSTGRTRLQDAIDGDGVLDFDFNARLQVNADTTGDAIFQSKDSGGSPGNTSGPRLTFTATLDSVT